MEKELKVGEVLVLVDARSGEEVGLTLGSVSLFR
jgi:hypothetical protein